MAIPSRQIGWSQESNLLSYISKQLEKLNGVVAATAAGGMLNPSTNVIPYNSGLAFGDSFLVNDATNSILKTVYSGQELGIKIDFVNGVYSFGDFNDNFGQGISLFIEDYNGIIKTSANGQDIGLKLDFANGYYNLGFDNTNGGHGLFQRIDTVNNIYEISLGFQNVSIDGAGFNYSKTVSSHYVTIGDYGAIANNTYLLIDDFNQLFELSGNLEANTAGASASKYLKVRIGGIDYKIALLITHKPMETNQALAILKQIVDQSIQAGVFKNAESVVAAANALQTVAQQLGALNETKS